MTPTATTGRTVTHFPMLDERELGRLFYRRPQPIPVDAERELLATALGATLYIPAIRDGLVSLIERAAAAGSVSIVIDLEDAVPDDAVAAGLHAVVAALDTLASRGGPLLFVRVRSADQIDALIAEMTTGADILAGFAIPKFGSSCGRDYLTRINRASGVIGRRLYAMPIIETPDVLALETRDGELTSIAALLAEFRDTVLAVRIGATDLCGAFGIRRDPDLTIYDVHPVASVIAAVVNILGRRDGTGFVITGPVWEYYNAHERMFRPLLRNTPFKEIDAVRFRTHLVSRDLDGLLRELVLDRANGLQGKTVIHPTHVNVVHSMCTVSHEEYVDALAVLGVDDEHTGPEATGDVGGVLPSEYRNKMNERRPHRAWAERTLTRATVFGVTRPDVAVIELLTTVVDR
ncbi:HpcH/HpaI aldolase/citrate lyase family protein [Williamsia phyllosphaerae]|uniref:ATP/GTP-binding protein n=1 Tax=Williamsia phyllosphaerae TaxID=885042 RepID=A0ABQ1V7J0_9NOCA|nr:HpcH/HpaI aldolase/citrate lyase family protein [Williamsia phyllosphaerae]GGF42778.1 ATP/GTP-binding protein [Williamsia phyllosphaerae]